MGLSGRKVKQRIGKDPRNLSWVDGKRPWFVQAMLYLHLSKFGWDASKGLGASGEGPTTAIKARQKLDMLGIGMQHQNDPNGLAWRQNRDFENVLRRLNEGVEATGPGPFHKARRESELLEGARTPGEGEAGEVGKVALDDDNDDDDDECECECEDAGARKRKEKKERKRKRKVAEADEEIHL